MFELVVFFLRYLFLILLYVFLFYVVRQMFVQFKYIKQAPVLNTGSSIPGTPACSSPPPPEARLVSLDKQYNQSSQMYPVGDSLHLGRASDNDVVIADLKVSRYHARIYNKQGQYWVEDLNSKNGVYLNDKKIRGPVSLADGDKIGVGHAVFVFVRWGHEVEQSNACRKSAQH